MTGLDAKIKEIADGYGKLTGRPKGWEAYISLSDYAVLREMALREAPMGISTAEEVYSSPTSSIIPQAEPIKQPVAMKKEPATTAQPQKETVKDTAPTKAAKTKDHAQAELDLLLALGEG